MAAMNIVRWTPVEPTPELPLGAFNLTWRAEGLLTCEGLYPKELNPAHKGILVSFDEVHAFMSFDEYSDYLEGIELDAPALAQPVAYGGCWPFMEIVGSSWLAELAERDGTLEAAAFRHWAILTRDQTLHVMADARSTPRFEGWLD